MVKKKNTKHWLITAFEPFAGRKQNNSMLVLDEMNKLALASDLAEQAIEFHYGVLPVVYDTCFQALDQLEKGLGKQGIHLEGILALGEGAEEFKLETQGANLDDVPEVADNSGVKRSEQKIFTDYPVDTPLALRFPFEAFNRIRTSKNAGFFVCNHLIAEMSVNYGSSERIPYFGFIHVPKVGSGGMFTPDVCAAVIFNGFRKLPVLS